MAKSRKAPEDESTSGLTQSDLVRLRMVLGRLGRMLRQQNDEDLPYALIALIFAIHRNEPVTAKQLAEAEGITPPAVTRSLARLEELGMIIRTAVPTDRRVQEIELSTKGERTRVSLLHKREIWLTKHLEKLDADDIGLLLSALPALERLTGFDS
ncbi:MarR family transcriptional regulator [Nakamurella sp. YIM 132087]|uniref:MarR family transcriptional regulator n=1 Tax=Nakamurella alba TaxID=2665158 RepID=A0A7K1FE84_9ACTN|nr:MarR family transcriptional regulator [Nakamurella alba]MTD12408.1 MarR family transcriptional regulator [Nakamurella alba]